jgi:hypothetical protein
LKTRLYTYIAVAGCCWASRAAPMIMEQPATAI